MAAHLAAVIFVAVGSQDWKSIPKNNQKNTDAPKQSELKHRCTKTKWRNGNFTNFKKGFGKSGIEVKKK